MDTRTLPSSGGVIRRPDRCDRIALVLQGGGALGAYQAGVYQALHEAGLEPDWISGVSIGGINAAIIAGNRIDKRLERLREFWTRITDRTLWLGTPDGDIFRIQNSTDVRLESCDAINGGKHHIAVINSTAFAFIRK